LRSSPQGTPQSAGALSPDDLLASLFSAPSAEVPKWRRKILHLPTDVAARVLQSALAVSHNFREYQRLAFALAKLPCSEARETLAAQIRENHPYASVAVRALEYGGTPECLDKLVELIGAAPKRLKRAIARALARRRYAPGLPVICHHAYFRNKQPDPFIVHALTLFGRPAAILNLLIEDFRLDAETVAATIVALEALPPVLRRLKVLPALRRMAEEETRVPRERVQAICASYFNRTTLLRPSEREASSTLLRPASGPVQRETETLLRPSSENDLREEPEEPRPWWSRLAGRIRDLLDGSV